PVPAVTPLMSRYSSNLPSARPGVRSPLGFWGRPRRPDSTSPSRFHPKSWVLVCVWAEPTPPPAKTMSAARRTPAVFVHRMGGLLAGQPEASRMIGAMDSHMAVVARPAHHEFLLRSYGAV